MARLLARYRLQQRRVALLPVIPNHLTASVATPSTPLPNRFSSLVERAFCRLKDWRRIATRYHKLAANYAASVSIAINVTGWRWS